MRVAGPDTAGASFARSLRFAREARELSREAVVYELTKLGNQVSVSTLLRWEKDGSIKAEDAWYLSQVYGMTIDELLLSGERSGPNGRDVAREDSGASHAARKGGAAVPAQKKRRTGRRPSG